MKKFSNLFFVLAVFAALSMSTHRISASWDDDPNSDKNPVFLSDGNSYLTSPMSVVTIDDFDNFDLGVDFAECHISENPLIPGQYFLAYNINGTYYTTNGIDWQRNNPTFPNSAGDPVSAWDSLGKLYYDNMKSPITGTWVVTSTNAGANWTSSVSANVGNDKNWIAADQTNGPYSNYIYGAMTPGNVVRSTDRGATFSTMFTSSNTLPGNMTAVGALGNVQGGAAYFVKSTGSAFAAVYTFFRSTNGGTSWEQMSAQNFANTVGTQVGGRNSVSNMRTRPYPFIGADNSYGTYRGRLYVVYASNNPTGNANKPDVFCRYSTDGGTTWSTEVVVNDDANSTLHNQWHPAMWVDKTSGRLYVQWMDTRDTPTSDSAFIYATYSTNGGESFVTNQRVSNKKFRINCTQCNGGAPAYLGDYNSIISNPVTSMLAWADFRNNNFGSYVAYFPDYALRMSPSAITINSSNFTTFRAVVPAVKLYTQSVTFTATVTPTPAAGALTAIFPNGNVLTNYPDSLLVRINAAPNTTAGNYTVTVEGKGPNGTPVHRRTVALTVGLVGISGENSNPEEFTLAQNFPNPFNPTTKIEYSLKARTDVRISVYDAMGRLVSSINKGVQDAGNHNVEFNGAALSSGVYYYKLQTPLFTDTKKMLLVK
ncbi:MAG: T9SS type A sorting domain-containing protein [Ignavibacteria bacterium]|nr:T9SS type A sorting domain-containing protein [Ignavibacteria bacterium]MBK9228525.1 T9SS type A sorting domain-containing protein [Ignavibacteria bacterium]